MVNISDRTIEELFMDIYENDQSLEYAVVTICKQLDFHSFGDFARVYRVCRNAAPQKEVA